MTWTYLLLIPVALVVLDLVSHVVYAWIALPHFESAPHLEAEPAHPHPHGEHIEIPTSDGLTLRGSLYLHEPGTEHGLVMFCPETGSSHWSVMNYLEGLYEAGFNLLSFDFRNQGESDSLKSYESTHWLTDYEVTDALAVVNYIDSHPELSEQRLGLFGVSRGAGAALAATAQRSQVECVAVEGAFSTKLMTDLFTQRWIDRVLPSWMVRILPGWHINLTMRVMHRMSGWRRGCHYVRLEQFLPKLQHRDVLVVAGASDSYVPVEIAKQLLGKMKHGHDDLWLVPRAKHNRARQAAPAEFDDRLIAFFSQLSPADVPAKPQPLPSVEA